MSSKDTGSSEHALIDLIYRHLKKYGYKKAASALKKQKHTPPPQVETTNVNVSLDDIFKKWLSEEQESKNDEGKDPQTHSVLKPQSATNAEHVISLKKKTPAAARNRKRTETKMPAIPSMGKSQTSGDSDSDTSLDVEKWKTRALNLSDSDISKMNAFKNIGRSTAKSTNKRKPAQPRKKQDQTTANSKPTPKKTKDKITMSPTKTDDITPIKPTDSSICESDLAKSPSKEATLTEPSVKSPESKADQVSTPKTGVNNGLSNSNRIKVKRKKTQSHSESQNIETPIKETEKTDDMTEPNPTDTPCKKKKKKKHPEIAKLAEMSGSLKQSECPKTDKCKNSTIVDPVGDDTLIQLGAENATGSLTSDQSNINQGSDINTADTPSKKSKSKKSKKSKETGDVAMSSGEGQIKADNSHFKLPKTENLSASVKEAKSAVACEPVGKQSKKSKKIFLEPNGTEDPSEKTETSATASIQLSTDTRSKKSKSKKTLQASQIDSPSKEAVVDVREEEAMTIDSFSKSDTLKKKKRKRTESSGENTTTSVADHVHKSSECDNTGVGYNTVSPGNSTKHQGQESVSAVEEEEGNTEPKKRKKHKKDKEKNKNERDENVEEVPPAPPAEEFSDSLSNTQKKKKKKKHKHREEEMPSMSS